MSSSLNNLLTPSLNHLDMPKCNDVVDFDRSSMIAHYPDDVGYSMSVTDSARQYSGKTRLKTRLKTHDDIKRAFKRGEVIVVNRPYLNRMKLWMREMIETEDLYPEVDIKEVKWDDATMTPDKDWTPINKPA